LCKKREGSHHDKEGKRTKGDSLSRCARRQAEAKAVGLQPVHNKAEWGKKNNEGSTKTESMGVEIIKQPYTSYVAQDQMYPQDEA
jgi:hypothetical protein